MGLQGPLGIRALPDIPATRAPRVDAATRAVPAQRGTATDPWAQLVWWAWLGPTGKPAPRATRARGDGMDEPGPLGSTDPRDARERLVPRAMKADEMS